MHVSLARLPVFLVSAQDFGFECLECLESREIGLW